VKPHELLNAAPVHPPIMTTDDRWLVVTDGQFSQQS